MKTILREKFKKRRREMDKEDVKAKSRNVCEQFIESDFYKNAESIMLYMPLGNETSTISVFEKAITDGKRVSFPVTDKDGNIRAVWGEGDTPFKKGMFSVREPQNSKEAKKEEIDIVLVPGICFSENGDRIGFGKGCYDRFLKGWSGVKIAFCYEIQLCNDFEGEEQDIKMDYIITEKRIIKCEKEV